MGEDVGVGRLAGEPRAHHERGVEPAPVLVGSLEVGDAARRGRGARGGRARARPRVAEDRVRDLDRAVGAAGIEPHIEDVGFLAKRPGLAALRAGEARGQEVLDRLLVPRVGASRARDLGGAAHDARLEQRCLARLAVDRGDAHAPGALARQAPVGAQAHRLADAVLGRGRLPAHRAVDQGEGAVAMAVVVDDHEPLVGGAEDDRLAAAPAVRIGMDEARGGEDAAALGEPAHDVVVDLEHAAAHERLGAGGEAARLVHRAQQAQALARADLEVLLAVAGRGVDQAGAVLEAHERRAVHHA